MCRNLEELGCTYVQRELYKYYKKTTNKYAKIMTTYTSARLKLFMLDLLLRIISFDKSVKNKDYIDVNIVKR